MSTELASKYMADEFKKRFQVAIKTDLDIFSNSHVTKRTDGKDFTTDQIAWLHGYDVGRATQ